MPYTMAFYSQGALCSIQPTIAATMAKQALPPLHRTMTRSSAPLPSARRGRCILFLGDDLVAERDALIADIHTTRACNQAVNLVLALAAERAVIRASFSFHCLHLPSFWFGLICRCSATPVSQRVRIQSAAHNVDDQSRGDRLLL
jgi:hypothetical protein